ncbi:MAG: ATP phosphoribosyltransferase [Clostridia bacterium]|nr:ATP phosphoribosyltransferase [Clostridia bacterium]MBO4428767.1 ATP phosphoribosyltransferase [Clostridia bacterium]
MKEFLSIALPKGRLGDNAYKLFADAGYGCPSLLEPGRKLIFENEENGVRFFWAKPSDVAIYVENGAADVGVVGLDLILEQKPDVFNLCDLGIGKCRVAVAAKRGFTDNADRALKVATKFVNIAKDHYAAEGRTVEIVKLSGSIELAPILGMTDVIVDIVETGETLRENDLVLIDEIMPISAHLIANKSSFRFKSEMIERLKRRLDERNEK